MRTTLMAGFTLNVSAAALLLLAQILIGSGAARADSDGGGTYSFDCASSCTACTQKTDTKCPGEGECDGSCECVASLCWGK